MKTKLTLAIFLIVIFSVSTLAVPGVFADYYVDIANSGDITCDGSYDKPWGTITRALLQVEGTEEAPVVIHVAAGIYDMEHGEEFPLVMKSFVSLIGAGSETTILDALHYPASVVHCSDVQNLTVEGFTLTGGSGGRIPEENGGVINYRGGGIYCLNSSPTFKDCLINGNVVEKVGAGHVWGGGVYCRNSSPTFERCIISDNKLLGVSEPWSAVDFTAKEDSSEGELDFYGQGGGISMWESSPVFIDCEISRNRAKEGGGILFEYHSSPVFVNCVIKDNIAGKEVDEPWIEFLDGGGVHCYHDSNAAFTDCVISGNQAMECGGGIWSPVPPMLINCTIAGNSAGWSRLGGVSLPGASIDAITLENCIISDNSAGRTGGGIDCGAGTRPGDIVTSITNSIFWNNGDDACGFGASVLTYCNIEGGYDGEGNIDVDPLFVSGSRGDYYLSQVSAGQPPVDSPCINAGIEMPFMGFDPKWRTTRTDGLFDTDIPDMGYHYNPHVMFDLNIKPEQEIFTSGDNLKLLIDVETAPAEQRVDIYFVMLNPVGVVYFGMDWGTTAKTWASGFKLPADVSARDLLLLDITIPSAKPPIEQAGVYMFAIGAFQPGSPDFISNLGRADFRVE